MIGSYQSLRGSIKKWRYDPSNIKYRNDVLSDTDTHTTDTALFSVVGDCWTFYGLFMLYIINHGIDRWFELKKNWPQIMKTKNIILIRHGHNQNQSKWISFYNRMASIIGTTLPVSSIKKPISFILLVVCISIDFLPAL